MRLKELREAAGVSQSVIADVLNIPRRTYSSYEIGTRKLPYEQLFALADYFKVTTDYLLGYSEVNVKNATSA